MALPTLATYEDVLDRTGSSSLDETQVVSLIEDATAMLLSLMGGRYDEGDELQQAALKSVCCNMVARATAASSKAGYGVTQWSQTASSFNEQFTYANPTGDLYLTAAEKKMLGIGRSTAFTVEPSIRPNYSLGSTVEPSGDGDE